MSPAEFSSGLIFRHTCNCFNINIDSVFFRRINLEIQRSDCQPNMPSLSAYWQDTVVTCSHLKWLKRIMIVFHHGVLSNALLSPQLLNQISRILEILIYHNLMFSFYGFYFLIVILINIFPYKDLSNIVKVTRWGAEVSCFCPREFKERLIFFSLSKMLELWNALLSQSSYTLCFADRWTWMPLHNRFRYWQVVPSWTGLF